MPFCVVLESATLTGSDCDSVADDMTGTPDSPSLEQRRKRYLLVRRIVLGAAVALGILIIGTLLWMVWLNQEHTSDVSTINSDGSAGQVLVIYHPGGTDFQYEATRAFADTLAGRDYAVDITTASSKAPTNIEDYDLLVLGSPVYAGKPAKPLVSYIERLGNLDGQPTVAIISGQGATDGAVQFTEGLINDANAQLLDLLVLWTSAPNEEMYGISDPIEIMEREAGALVIP